MENLEEKLKSEFDEIERLKCGLNAEIVLQEQRGRYETVCSGGGSYPPHDDNRGGCYSEGIVSEEWVETVPRIAKPDLEQRKASLEELNQLYESTNLLSIKYISADVLGVMSAFKASMDQHLNGAKKEDLKFFYDTLSEKACFGDDENIRKKLGNILGYSEGFVLGDRLDKLFNAREFH